MVKGHGKNTTPIYDYDSDGDIVVTAGVVTETGPDFFEEYFTLEELIEIRSKVRGNIVADAMKLCDVFNFAVLEGSSYFNLDTPLLNEKDIIKREKEIYEKFDPSLFDISKLISTSVRLLTCIHPNCESRRDSYQKSICIIIVFAFSTDSSFVFCSSCRNFYQLRGYIPPNGLIDSTNSSIKFSYLNPVETKIIDEKGMKRSGETKRGTQKVIITGELAERYIKSQQKKFRGKRR